MRWTSILAIYFIMWFLCLFLVLPFHARGNQDAELVPGQERGAPARFHAGRVAAQVTLLAAIMFGLYYANYVNGWIGVDDINFVKPPGG